ncbi:MAG: ATP-binding protein [Oscillospiraceae bacterium]
MITSPASVTGAADTLNKRRQITAVQLMKRQQQVYKLVPEIEELGFEITSLGASYAMANLAKHPEKALEIKAQMNTLEQRKKQLLKDNLFDEDYLEQGYFCKICRDKGFVNGKVCVCMQQEIARQQQNSLSSLSPAPDTSFEDFSLNYYPDVTDENGNNPRRQMSQVLAYCKDFANGFSRNRKSVLMCGTSGLGKTHLSCAIAKECMAKGFIVMYASSQSLFNQIDKLRPNDNGIVNDILSCDLFILDDLGTEYMTPYCLSVLYNIINSRMIKGLCCIYSTNLTNQKALTAKYGDKITSRLVGSCDTLYFLGNDIRFINK